MTTFFDPLSGVLVTVPPLGSDDNYVTDAEKVILSNITVPSTSDHGTISDNTGNEAARTFSATVATDHTVTVGGSFTLIPAGFTDSHNEISIVAGVTSPATITPSVAGGETYKYFTTSTLADSLTVGTWQIEIYRPSAGVYHVFLKVAA